jgi:Ser/Thr protein kinase RdoA (MazF antagonist)
MAMGQDYSDAGEPGKEPGRIVVSGDAECFPVQYSTLSSEALKEKILSKYAFHNEVRCEYLYRGLNDNYLVHDADSKYILRVYRHAWRNLQDIESEMELLQYLKSNGVSVSFPIPDKENTLIQKISAPEGLRHAVLFSYAKGDTLLNAMTLHQSRNAGRELAKIHSLTINRRLKNNRCHLDVISLLYESFYAIKPFIEERPEDMRDFEEIIQTLRTKFEEISLSDLSFGICHGDLYPANYHVSMDDEVTLFDFDECCCSWFVMDVAAFCYVSTKYYRNADEVKKAFLEGYQEVRTLSKVEIDLIPYFGAINYIWVLGTQCANFEVFCHFVRTNIKRNIIKNLKQYVDKYCP